MPLPSSMDPKSGAVRQESHPRGRGGVVLPSDWAAGPGNANEAPGAGWELAEGKVEAGLGPGPLHGAGKGGGRNVTTGTRSQRINIDVDEDRTIIGFGGASQGLQGSVGGRKWGLLQVGWGRRRLFGAPSRRETPARAPGGGHICTGAGAHLHTRERAAGQGPRHAACRPHPHRRARAQPRWLADTRSRCLPCLAPTLPPPIPRGSRIQKGERIRTW